MLKALTQPRTLWILFGLFVLETIGFAVVMMIWDFQIIDEMSNPDHIKAHIKAMTDLQRHVHAVMTATLDVAYPLTYSSLLGGLALRAFRPAFALPAAFALLTDLAEGFVQVMALTERLDVIWLKAYLTPLKLGLFIIAILIALAALFKLYKR